MDRGQNRTAGMAGFVVVWIGQVVSLLGTAMSDFALTLWAYEVTGRATPLAMLGFFFLAPQVALGPFVGVLVDRGNRKLMMMASDLAAAAVSATILTLHLSGRLQIWHLYVTAVVFGTFQGFQWPAFSTAITLMLPKEQYARANGMLEMAGNSSAILAPILAGALIGPLGLAGILTLDLVAAGVAIGALLLVYVPPPPRTAAGQEAAGSFLREALYGFRYIFARPSLLGLQSIFLVGNLFGGIAYAVVAPLLLGRTGNNELIFGTVQSVSAVGGLVGGLAMSIWGGPKRRVHGVLLGWFLSSVLGQMVLGLGQALPVWIAGGFLFAFFNPFINGCNQAIWQSKVAPDVQGRVFTARQFIAWLVLPLSQLLAGPLSDRLLEPAMADGGSLAPAFGWLVGTGTGAGIGLLFVVTGLLAGLVGLAGYLVPAIRDAEDLLPDHDLSAAPA